MARASKGYSLKRHVNIFYTIILVVMSYGLIFTLYFNLGYRIDAVSNRALENAVHEGFNYISAPGEWLEVSDQFNYYVNDVHLLIYGPEEHLVSGALPRDFPRKIPLTSDRHRTVEENDRAWKVYDYFRTYPNGAGIWIRGIYAYDLRLQSLRHIFRLMLILTPIFVLLASVVGTLMIRRGLRPMKVMTETAESIRNDRNLSRRIELPDTASREFVELASTYNHMLASVEDAFRREKQFSGDVAHELRTPIAVMISQTEYALSLEPDEETAKALETVLNQGQRISRIISQLLTLSRHEEGRVPLPDEAIDFSELCEMVMLSLEMDADARDIELRSALKPGLTVTGDQTELMRLVINIGSNAIRYGQEGGYVAFELRAVPRPDRALPQQATTWARLDIEDNGRGIAKQDLERIFDRFYQVDPSRKRAGDSSSGLGLTMSQAIAKRHQGFIEVDSELGVGTTFHIYLPLRQNPPGSPPPDPQ